MEKEQEVEIRHGFTIWLPLTSCYSGCGRAEIRGEAQASLQQDPCCKVLMLKWEGKGRGRRRERRKGTGREGEGEGLEEKGEEEKEERRREKREIKEKVELHSHICGASSVARLPNSNFLTKLPLECSL